MQNKGQMLGVAVGAYMIVKEILNAIMVGGSLNLYSLIIAIAAAAVLWFGVKYTNYVVAVILMLVACTHLPDNLRNIGLNAYLIYTIEGVIDMLAAVLLAFHPDIRQHCKLSR